MLGAVAGSFLAGVLSTSYGRLTLLTGSQAVAAVFSVLSAFSQNIWQFLVLRAVLAASMEVSTSMAQVYAVEMSPRNSRALVSTGNFAFWSLGSFTAAGVSYLLLESAGWRAVLLVISVSLIVCAVCLGFQHESPFYDVASDKLVKAQETLDFIFKHNKTDNLPGLLVRHDDVEDPSSFKLSDIPRNRTFVMDTAILQLATLSIFLTFGFTTWVVPRIVSEGYCIDNFIKKHSVESKCNAYSADTLLSLTIGTLGEIFGCLIFYVMMETIGRLWTMRIGCTAATVTTISLLMCGGAVKLTIDIFLMRLMNSGLFTTYLLYMNEYYPTHLRAMANSFSFGIGRTFSLTVIIPSFLLSMGQMWLLILYILIVDIIVTVLIFLLGKETKGLVLV